MATIKIKHRKLETFIAKSGENAGQEINKYVFTDTDGIEYFAWHNAKSEGFYESLTPNCEVTVDVEEKDYKGTPQRWLRIDDSTRVNSGPSQSDSKGSEKPETGDTGGTILLERLEAIEEKIDIVINTIGNLGPQVDVEDIPWDK